MLRNKFRVWCKNSSQWEKDFCAIDQDGQLYQVINKVNYSPKMIRISEDTHVVEMYTGLNDSTRSEEFPEGKPIFEGDIVMTINHDRSKPMHGIVFVCEVVWSKCKFQEWCLVNDNPNTHFSMSSELEITVIGNIHQNKELLYEA